MAEETMGDMVEDRKELTRVALLRERIQESKMSVKDFAERLLVRDEGTVRRWFRGGQIPETVMRWLRDPPPPWPPEDEEG